MKEKISDKHTIKKFPSLVRRIFPLIILTIVSLTANAANYAAVNAPRAAKNAAATTDLALSITDSPDPVARGANVTYTFTVQNTTAEDAQNFTLKAYVPTFSTFVSFSAPNGFNCTSPDADPNNQLSCSAATVAGNSTNIFTLTVKVDDNAPLDASLYESARITASNDTDGQNNSAAEVTYLSGGIFVSTVSGDYQTTNINTPFPTNLKVRVTDGNSNPLANVTATFTAPTTGASGTFTGGVTTVNITTDQDGYATAPVFTANGIAGSYTVTATTQNANSSATFNLNNVAPMTYTVNNTNDDGPGSLRQAIENANDNSGDDNIVFDSSVFSTPQIIVLTSGEIMISGNGSLLINGAGANRLTISGGNNNRIFVIAGANAILNDLNLSNGVVNDSSGGAIVASFGTLQINRCAFSSNNASGGGGAIAAVGTDLTINRSTFSGNISSDAGGAILLFAFEGSSRTSIVNSTFSQNSATQGGAVYKGSAIFGGDPLQLNLTSVTIDGNTATDTGGVFVENGNFNVVNSIIAGNTGGDINGTVTSQGYNLIQSAANTTFGGGQPQTTDIIGQNPLLESLANNGGTTRTMKPMPNSPVIDKGTSANLQLNSMNLRKAQPAKILAVTTDQRGAARPFDNPAIANTGDGSDIGAFEFAAPTAAGVEIAGRVLTPDGRGLQNTAVTLTDQTGAVKTIRTGSFGYFRFAEAGAGQTYVVSVNSKLYVFAPQIINVTDDLNDLTFIATLKKDRRQ